MVISYNAPWEQKPEPCGRVLPFCGWQAALHTPRPLSLQPWSFPYFYHAPIITVSTCDVNIKTGPGKKILQIFLSFGLTVQLCAKNCTILTLLGRSWKQDVVSIVIHKDMPLGCIECILLRSVPRKLENTCSAMLKRDDNVACLATQSIDHCASSQAARSHNFSSTTRRLNIIGRVEIAMRGYENTRIRHKAVRTKKIISSFCLRSSDHLTEKWRQTRRLIVLLFTRSVFLSTARGWSAGKPF